MKLTIGILISNRINTVKRCLESVKPLLDKGIAELICVDTVTDTPGIVSDGSADIARQYTDKVFKFKWVNDFSAARNVTLEHATGEWYMFSDDDEWFDDVSEIIDFFESGEYKHYNSAAYLIRNYKNKLGSEWADTRAVRFVKRTNDLKFIGAVHETYSSLKLPCKEFSTFAHHYGYAFDSEKEKKEHRERNVTLLEEEIKRRPKDLRLRTQMALELATYDNEKALKYVNEVLGLFVLEKEEPYYQWLEVLKFRIYEALGISAAEAEKEYESIMQSVKLSEMAQLAIHYEFVRLWLLEENKHCAKKHIIEYYKYYEFLKNNPDITQIQNTVDFERYLSDETYNEIKKYEEYCMNDNTLKMGYGTIKFGEKVVSLEGTTEEKLKKLDELGFDEFEVAINNLIKQVSSCFEDDFLNAAIDYFEKKSPIEYSYILYKMSEEEIKRAVEKGCNGAAIYELYIQSICTERKMYEMLYKPEVFTERGLNWVSSEVRYNDLLYRFITSEKPDLKLCLEAAKIRPDMANVIKVWIGSLK
ncbi:glycosyltransferase [Ruminococcus sp.]|uniref:glycosyltransferase n=1 Tax=Ruminococcus sp. TaxID=41978 RepID=UPI00258A27ED|nr:glycosyltransferase [Ruminococcus sp.]MCR5021374.1 glycosyltransferase [Ruminococcus sp.]